VEPLLIAVWALAEPSLSCFRTIMRSGLVSDRRVASAASSRGSTATTARIEDGRSDAAITAEAPVSPKAKQPMGRPRSGASLATQSAATHDAGKQSRFEAAHLAA
jgi:hypothetical protein